MTGDNEILLVVALASVAIAVGLMVASVAIRIGHVLRRRGKPRHPHINERR